MTTMGVLALPLLLSGCGGGGGNSSPSREQVGIYNGTYLFVSSNGTQGDDGSFALTVQSNGGAIGVFNDNTIYEVTTKGKIKDGKLSMEADFDNLAGGDANVKVTRTVTKGRATGQIVLEDDDGRGEGTFSATKTSDSMTRTAQSDEAIHAPDKDSTRKKLG